MSYYFSGNIRLAYTESFPLGKVEKSIILIHGFASNHIMNWSSVSWIKTLCDHGYHVITIDLRGHGQSDRLYQPEDYKPVFFQNDIYNLMNHLNISQAVIMGYSMGARIAALFANHYPQRIHSLILAGIGDNLLQETSFLPESIAQALETPDRETLQDPLQKMFRRFAEKTHSDLKALTACIRGFSGYLTQEQLLALKKPVLIANGTKDTIIGSTDYLRQSLPQAFFLDIPERDHNTAVGDPVFKQGVLHFLSAMNG